jgi:hypothetical protein
VAGVVLDARVEQVGDAGPVRGPGGKVAGPLDLGEALGLARAVDGHRVQIPGEADVPVVVPGRGEHDPGPVRGPGPRPVLELPVGQPVGLGRPVGGDHEQVLAVPCGPSDAVELELQAGQPAGPTLLLVLLLVVGLRQPGGEQDARPVRRPDRVAYPAVEVGQASRLAAAGGHHVQLGLVLVP